MNTLFFKISEVHSELTDNMTCSHLQTHETTFTLNNDIIIPSVMRAKSKTTQLQLSHLIAILIPSEIILSFHYNYI